MASASAKNKIPAKAHSYQEYTQVMKQITAMQTAQAMPRLIVLSGESDFLRMRSLYNISQHWSKHGGDETQSIELNTLDPSGFRSLWAQVSLFEPEMMYLLKRCDKHAKLATWLKEVKEASHLKTHLVFEFSEKIPAELSRQLTRLDALFVPCVEPTTPLEYSRLIVQMAKRDGLVLADDAVKLLLDAMGQDLAKLHNEVVKIGLVYQDRKAPLRAVDIAAIVGSLREDHVFELFHFLRNRQRAKAQLLLDHLLDRGEKSIALIGILSRYSRELVAKGSERGMRALQLCAQADILVKSSRTGDAPLLGTIVDALVE